MYVWTWRHEPTRRNDLDANTVYGHIIKFDLYASVTFTLYTVEQYTIRYDTPGFTVRFANFPVWLKCWATSTILLLVRFSPVCWHTTVSQLSLNWKSHSNNPLSDACPEFLSEACFSTSIFKVCIFNARNRQTRIVCLRSSVSSSLK